MITVNTTEDADHADASDALVSVDQYAAPPEVPGSVDDELV